MIITLAKANFSMKNIGTLNSFPVLTNLGAGVVYEGPSMVDKNGALTATVSALKNYKIVAGEVVVTMGGEVITEGVTITSKSITINIPAVTGAVFISIGGEFNIANAGLELILGYANGTIVTDNELKTRVRTPRLYGNYRLTVNPDYRIRMVVTDLSADETVHKGTIYSNTSTTLTSIEVNNPEKYSIITFAHADATKEITPDDAIIATYEPLNFHYEEGAELTTTLAQGYALDTGLNSTQANRVRTAVIQGPFKIECNDGFVVRGVTTSTNPDGYTGGKNIVSNAQHKQYECTADCLGYTIVTFAKNPDATVAISPSDNIIKKLTAMNLVKE